MSKRVSRRGCLLSMVFVAVLIGTGVAMPSLLDMWSRSDPAASAPADLCAAVGGAVFENAVPDAVPSVSENYSSGSDARCVYRTPDDPSAGPAYGMLSVRLLRYGRIGWQSGVELAADALAGMCDENSIAGRFRPHSGIADDACTAFQESSDTASAAVAMLRRGADLVQIDYYRLGASDAELRDTLDAVVAATLAGVR